MKDNIFKTLFLLVSICILFVLVGIYQKMSVSRYQVINEQELFDTKTNEIYFHRSHYWGKITNDGKRIDSVKTLPK